jgi:DNA repair protein RadC
MPDTPRTAPLPLAQLDPAALLAQLAGLPYARAAALLAAAPLATLVRETPEALETLHKLTPTQAGAIHAGLTLGRLTCTSTGEEPKYSSPRGIAEYLIPRYGHLPTEHFGIFCLDTKHHRRGESIISTGSLDSTVVHPREVFRAATIRRAASIVLFHNHPSGDPTPSPDDLALTTRLVQAGAIMGIDVLDHLILTTGKYFSMMDAGRMQK